MREAHEGVPAAGLPLGTWRNADAPNPDAPLLPPLDLTGAQAPTPLPGGRGGAQSGAAPQAGAPLVPAPSPRGALGPAADWAPIPPASIPNASPASRDKGAPG